MWPFNPNPRMHSGVASVTNGACQIKYGPRTTAGQFLII